MTTAAARANDRDLTVPIAIIRTPQPQIAVPSGRHRATGDTPLAFTVEHVAKNALGLDEAGYRRFTRRRGTRSNPGFVASLVRAGRAS